MVCFVCESEDKGSAECFERDFITVSTTLLKFNGLDIDLFVVVVLVDPSPAIPAVEIGLFDDDEVDLFVWNSYFLRS